LRLPDTEDFPQFFHSQAKVAVLESSQSHLAIDQVERGGASVVERCFV